MSSFLALDPEKSSKLSLPSIAEISEQAFLTRICPLDDNPLDLADDYAKNSQQLVCTKCASCFEVPNTKPGAEKFFRSPSNIAVKGNALGMNHEDRNADRSSNLYRLHGDNGKYKNPVLHDYYTREMTFKGMEEDPDTAVIKQMGTALLLSSGSEAGEVKESPQIAIAQMPTWSDIVQVMKNMENPQYEGREGRFLVFRSIAGIKVLHDINPASKDVMSPKKEEIPSRVCPCYYCIHEIELHGPEVFDENVEQDESEEIAVLVQNGRIGGQKSVLQTKAVKSDNEKIAEILGPIIRQNLRTKKLRKQFRIRSESTKLKHPLYMRPGTPGIDVFGLRMLKEEVENAAMVQVLSSEGIRVI